MSLLELLGALLVAAALPFFALGTLGLVRMPDFYGRLHALTKADNVGLGLLVTGLAVQADDLRTAAALLLVWVLVLVSTAPAAHLLAGAARRAGIQPWRRR